MKVVLAGIDPNKLNSLPILKSIQRVFKNISIALESLGSKTQVIKAWEGNVDFSQVDAIIGTYEVLRIRHQLKLDIPVLVFPLGDMPNGGLLLFAHHGLFRPYDCIAFSCSSDFVIFNRLVEDHNLIVRVIPFPIDCDVFFRKSVDQELLRKKIGIPGKGKILIYAGRISLQKNLHTLIRILEEVMKEKEVFLCIAGSPDQTPLKEFGISGDNYAQRLDEMIKKKGLTNNVIFPGHIDDNTLVEMFSVSDLFVNATIHHDENFGFSQVEAQACGLPIVASEWGGIKDTVIHGKTGFLMQTLLTDNGPRLEWLSGVKYILSLLSDSSLWKAISDECRLHALSNYSFKAVGNKIMEALKDMIYIKTGTREIALPAIKIKDEVKNYIIDSIKPIKTGKLRYHLLPVTDSQGAKWFYRTRMEPYSSMKISEIDDIDGAKIPYKVIDMNIHKDNSVVKLLDLLWCKEVQIDPASLSFLILSDGKKCIDEICYEIGVSRERGFEIFKKLIRDGLILFIQE